MPLEARWAQIESQVRRPEIAKLIDDAMYAIERDNRKLKGVLLRDYARRADGNRELLGGSVGRWITQKGVGVSDRG